MGLEEQEAEQGVRRSEQGSRRGEWGAGAVSSGGQEGCGSSRGEQGA